MDATAPSKHSSAARWWEKRRKPYNLALVLAGVGAFACYGAVVEHFSCSGAACPGSTQEIEITLFTILFQGVGYLAAMGIANALFGLGAFSEKLFRPEDPQKWRRTCFLLGLCFSVLLPFTVPVVVALRFAGGH